jgi:hypothetical protein
MLLGAGSALAAPGWFSPVNLSAAGKDPAPDASPQVAVNQAGDAVAVWLQQGPNSSIVQVAVRPAGGSFGAPVDLSAAGQSAYEPQVAVDAAGQAVVVWQLGIGSNLVVQAAVRPAGRSFGAPVDLSTHGQNAYYPQVAVDAAGDAVVVWQLGIGSTAVQAAVRPAGRSFGAPVDLSAAGQNAYYPQVAVDATDEAVAVWAASNGSNGNSFVQAAVRPAGGSFGALVDLSAAGQCAYYPDVAVDPAGDAVAVWQDSGCDTFFPNPIVQAAVRPAGGSFGAPADVSAAGTYYPRVAVGRAGGAVAVWQAGLGGGIVQAAVRPAGGSFGVPVGLSAAGQNAYAPDVAVDRAGDAVTVWQHYNGRNDVVQEASYDLHGPHLSALSAAPDKFSLAGRLVSGRCVKPTTNNAGKRCRRAIKLKVRYTLNGADMVTFTLRRKAPGRTIDGRCVKPTQKNRNHKQCMRRIELNGQIVKTGAAGANSFVWDGKIGGHKLAPGKYQLTAAPFDGAQETVGFKIVR